MAKDIANVEKQPVSAQLANAVVKTLIDVNPGQTVRLGKDVNFATSKVAIEGENLVIKLPSGEQIVLVKFIDSGDASNPASLQLADDTVLPAPVLLDMLAKIGALQTAEGVEVVTSGAHFARFEDLADLPGIRPIGVGNVGLSGRALDDIAPQREQLINGLKPLFTAQNDTVDFNTVKSGTYVPETQYKGLDGDDTVTLANNFDAARAAGFDPLRNFDAGDGNDSVTGGGLDDLISGGNGNDILIGNGGNDVLSGGDGNDTIYGGNGDDLINGDNGDDILYGDDGADTISGGAGDDQIFGGAGNDILDGGEGNDKIFGDAGDDIIDGGAGDDILNGGDGNDFLSGGTGIDLLFGGAGDDFFQATQDAIWQGFASTGRFGETSVQIGNGFGGASAPIYEVYQDQYNGGDGNDTLIGTAGGDVFILDSQSVSVDFFGNQITPALQNLPLISNIENIVTGAGDDVVNLLSSRFTYGDVTIDGGDGNDFIWSNAGNDTLIGGNGNDLIDGDAGDDAIFGGSGNDILIGREGNDIFDGGDGNDTINGDAGNDILNGGNDDDTLNGGDGIDTIHGDAGNDIITGGNGDDILFGDAGDDTIHGNEGNDVISGGSGNDFLFGDAGNDTINGDAGNDSISGGDGNDILNGGDGDDTLNGGDGIDTIHGDAGNDIISGGNGDDDDILFGDAGNDRVDGGAGNDQIFGGEGNDTLIGGLGDDTINGGNGDDDIQGDAGNDVLLGGDGSDLMEGGDGNDTINGEDGNDFLYGDAGNDIVTGGAGDDYIEGNDGNDTLSGNDGDDVLVGGEGNDNLNGGLGVDLLYAEAGDDQLFYTADQIIDNTGFFVPVTGNWIVSSAVDGIDNLDAIDVASSTSPIYNLSTDLFDGGAGNDTLTLTAGNDVLINDTIFDPSNPGVPIASLVSGIEIFELGAGNDILDLRNATFLSGDVLVNAGDGNDAVWGNEGNDILNGNAGNDLLSGGAGDDELYGGAGNDMLHGGDGNDFLSGGTGIDLLFGGDGDDFFQATQDAIWQGFASTGRFGETSVQIGNGLGNPSYSIFQDQYNGGNGDDTLIGTSGRDVFILDSQSVSIDFFGNQIAPALQNLPLISNIENIITGAGDDVVNLLSSRFTYGDITIDAGDGNDFIWSSAGNDTLIGGNGNDLIDGDLGDDTIFGGNGNDILIGREGNDILDGGLGIDTMTGGSGNDTFVYHSVAEGAATETITDFQTGQDTIRLENILSGFIIGVSNINNFAKFVDGAGFTKLQIDIDGLLNGSNFVDLVRLNGVTLAGGGVNTNDITVA